MRLARVTALKQTEKQRNRAETRRPPRQPTITLIDSPRNPRLERTPEMKTWIKRSLIAAATLALVAGGLAACGSHHHPRWGGFSEERIGEMRSQAVERISSRLDLDAAQRARLNALADELMAQRQALRGESATANAPREQLRSLIAGSTFDRTQARSLLEQKTGAVQAQGPKVLDALANFYDSLNPQQQAQVREMLEQRGSRGGWGRG